MVHGRGQIEPKIRGGLTPAVKEWALLLRYGPRLLRFGLDYIDKGRNTFNSSFCPFLFIFCALLCFYINVTRYFIVLSALHLRPAKKNKVSSKFEQKWQPQLFESNYLTTCSWTFYSYLYIDLYPHMSYFIIR